MVSASIPFQRSAHPLVWGENSIVMKCNFIPATSTRERIDLEIIDLYPSAAEIEDSVLI